MSTPIVPINPHNNILPYSNKTKKQESTVIAMNMLLLYKSTIGASNAGFYLLSISASINEGKAFAGTEIDSMSDADGSFSPLSNMVSQYAVNASFAP